MTQTRPCVSMVIYEPDLVFTVHSLRQAPRRLQSAHRVLLDRTPTPQVCMSANREGCCF